MLDKLKFPHGGYEVEVCRRDDIIEALPPDADKELILAIITQCETDAVNFLREGRWTGIPYLGNIRISQHEQKFIDIKGRELLNTAKLELDKERYDVFKKSLNNSIEIDIKRERLYRYMTSCFVTKHRRNYNYLITIAKENNIKNIDGYARFMCYSFIDLSNYIPFE